MKSVGIKNNLYTFRERLTYNNKVLDKSQFISSTPSEWFQQIPLKVLFPQQVDRKPKSTPKYLTVRKTELLQGRDT